MALFHPKRLVLPVLALKYHKINLANIDTVVAQKMSLMKMKTLELCNKTPAVINMKSKII